MGSFIRVLVPAVTGTRKKLIKQAAAATRGKPPPAELALAWKCKQWGALLVSGGIYDQPYQTMQAMTAASNVYDTLAFMHNLKGRDIHRLTDQQRRIIRGLLDMGIRVN